MVISIKEDKRDYENNENNETNETFYSFRLFRNFRFFRNLSSSSGHKNNTKVINHRGIEEHTVEPVEETAVAGNQFAGIFRLCSALDHRFAEIAGNSQQSHKYCQRYRLTDFQFRKEGEMSDYCREYAGYQTSNPTLDRLARTDPRSEFMPSDRSAGIISPGVS